MGKYLYDSLDEKKPIIGVAKNRFKQISLDHAVYRGDSKKPLFVTGIDIALDKAKNVVQHLAGKYRLPTVITQVDQLGRALI